MKYKVKKVKEMPATVKKEIALNKNAFSLSQKIAKSTKAAGISYKELEERAYEALLNVKKSRRSGSN